MQEDERLDGMTLMLLGLSDDGFRNLDLRQLFWYKLNFTLWVLDGSASIIPADVRLFGLEPSGMG